MYRKLGSQRGQIQLKCDLRDTVASSGIRYGVKERTASPCDVSLCNERRQIVCTETLRMGDAPRRPSDLRGAFQRLGQIWGQLC